MQTRITLPLSLLYKSLFCLFWMRSSFNGRLWNPSNHVDLSLSGFWQLGSGQRACLCKGCVPFLFKNSNSMRVASHPTLLTAITYSQPITFRKLWNYAVLFSGRGAVPTAYGSSQARGQKGAAATTGTPPLFFWNYTILDFPFFNLSRLTSFQTCTQVICTPVTY